ncbi:MAG: hypothetical protein SGJ19_29390, partial [Planctomycetia bacterium]|nr:hypothetical protein [Planctomycetia bacterium]
DLADWLVGRLAYHRDDVVRAAWFLELARKLQDDVTSFTDPWRRRLRDRTLLEGAAAVVIEKLVPHELSPTYWNDTLRTVVGI